MAGPNANFTFQNRRTTDYKRSTLSSNKWFPLKHDSQATEYNVEKNGIWRERKKKLKEEQTTNLPLRPSSTNKHKRTRVFFSFSPVDSNGTREKNCTRLHTATEKQAHIHSAAKKRNDRDTKRKNQNENNDQIHSHQCEHLHNSIEYPNFCEFFLRRKQSSERKPCFFHVLDC